MQHRKSTNPKVSSKLWMLIKSLSRGEKKSVLSAVKYHKEGKSNLIRLYLAIEKQKEYDEQALKRQFEGTKMVKHFASAKVHLYDFILKNLADYHQNLSPKTLAFDLLKRAEILFNKGFHSECRQLLDKIGKIAQNYSLLTAQYEVVNMKMNLASLRIGQEGQSENQFLIEERAYIIKQLDNISTYKLISNEIYSIYRQLYGNTSEDLKRTLEHLMSHPLLQDESEAISYESRKSFYYIHFLYNAIIGHMDISNQFMKKRIQWIETKPYILKREMPFYLRDLVNLARAQLQIKEINEAKSTLIKLQELPKKYPNSFNVISIKLLFNKVLLIKSMICLTILDLEEFDDISSQVEKHILNAKTKNDERDTFYIYCHLMNIEFYRQNYNKAIDWYARIQELGNKDDLAEEMIVIYILNMLCHYELKNYTLLGYLAQQTFRYMNKMGKSNPLKRTFLNFIKSTLSNPIINTQDFEKCKMKLIKIQESTDAKLLPNFNVNTWLESKIQKKSFLEYTKQSHMNILR